MPTNHTPNYHLNQWEADDRVLRTDFNADNAKIDAALAAQAEAVRSINNALAGVVKFAAGSYTGDNAASRTISIGFTPKAVFVITDGGLIHTYNSSDNAFYGGLTVTGHPAGGIGYPAVEIVNGGIKVFYRIDGMSSLRSNQKDFRYNYVAFG